MWQCHPQPTCAASGLRSVCLVSLPFLSLVMHSLSVLSTAACTLHSFAVPNSSTHSLTRLTPAARNNNSVELPLVHEPKDELAHALTIALQSKVEEQRLIHPEPNMLGRRAQERDVVRQVHEAILEEAELEKKYANQARLNDYNREHQDMVRDRKQAERDSEKQQARRANDLVAEEAARIEADAAARKHALASDMMSANNTRIDEMRRQKDAEMAAKKRELESQSDFAFSEARHHGEGDSAARKAAYRKDVEDQIQSQMAIKAAQKAAERAGNVGTGLSMIPSEENRAAGNYFDREAYKHELDNQISTRDGTRREEAMRAQQTERDAADVTQRQLRSEQEADQKHKVQVSFFVATFYFLFFTLSFVLVTDRS